MAKLSLPLSSNRGLSRALRSRLGVMLGVCVICVALTKAHEHAYVAAIGAAAFLITGILWPLAAIRFVSVSLDPSTGRSTVGDSIAITIRASNRLPIPLPGIYIPPDVMVDLKTESKPFVCVAGLSVNRKGVTTEFGSCIISCDPFSGSPLDQRHRPSRC